MFQGTNGSQLWDTALGIQAFIENEAYTKSEFDDCLTKVHGFLKYTQIPENPPGYKKYYRQMSKVRVVISPYCDLSCV